MAGKDEILKKFNRFNARIVFSAETSLWPDKSLKVVIWLRCYGVV